MNEVTNTATNTEQKQTTTSNTPGEFKDFTFGASKIMQSYRTASETKDDKSKEKPKPESTTTEGENSDKTGEKPQEGGKPSGSGNTGDTGGSQNDKPRKKLEELPIEEVIEEVKKNQRISQSRFDENVKLRKEIDELKASLEGKKIEGKDGNLPGDEASSDIVRKFEAFKKGIKEDFKATWSKMAAELDLPKLEHILPQMSSSNPNETQSAKLKSWQNSVLKKEIEKQFNLTEGTFKFSADDAEEVGTPSYEYRKRTRQREIELESQTIKAQADEEARLKEIYSKQEEDISYLAKSYFDGDQQKVKDLFAKIDLEIMPKVNNGTIEYEKNPFALRNIVRGYFFEDLMTGIKTKLVEDIKKQYASLGMYLPAKEEFNLLPSEAPKEDSKPQGKTPLQRLINRHS